jgi:nucleotide-binding universal stress UspA family protein
MKTLMTTDGSEEALTALRTACRLLRKSRNEVEVLCVAPELFLPKGKKAAKKEQEDRIRERYRERITVETGSILDQARKILREEGIDAKVFSEIGSPAGAIVRLAEDYDVTVIGAEGRYQQSRVGLGPVASRVIEHARGTVLVGRELASANGLRVLVALDGSTASNHALHIMAAYFNVDEAEITLLHVKETPWIHLGLDREWFDYPGDVLDRANPEVRLEEELQRESERILEDAHAQLAKYNYSLTTVIGEGSPATEILGEADSGGYDLIILGATGATDAKHKMLGSVSAKVAWQTTCSVAVVKYVE